MVDSLHTSEIPVGGALIKVSLNWKQRLFKIAVLRRNKLLCFVIANNLQFSILSKFSFARILQKPNCSKKVCTIGSLWKLKYFPGFKKKSKDSKNNENLQYYTFLHGNNPFSYFGSFNCIISYRFAYISIIFNYVRRFKTCFFDNLTHFLGCSESFLGHSKTF